MALCPSGETLTLNLTLAFVPAIDAMPGRRGFGGSELTELCEILDVFFYFFCFVYSCSDDHAEQNRRDRAGVVVS